MTTRGEERVLELVKIQITIDPVTIKELSKLN